MKMQSTKSNLKSILEQRSITQTGLAKKLGVHSSLIRGWSHNNHIPIKWKPKIAEVLNIPLDVLDPQARLHSLTPIKEVQANVLKDMSERLDKFISDLSDKFDIAVLDETLRRDNANLQTRVSNLDEQIRLLMQILGKTTSLIK